MPKIILGKFDTFDSSMKNNLDKREHPLFFFLFITEKHE